MKIQSIIIFAFSSAFLNEGQQEEGRLYVEVNEKILREMSLVCELGHSKIE
jgi:hypothetical protein